HQAPQPLDTTLGPTEPEPGDLRRRGRGGHRRTFRRRRLPTNEYNSIAANVMPMSMIDSAEAMGQSTLTICSWKIWIGARLTRRPPRMVGDAYAAAAMANTSK